MALNFQKDGKQISVRIGNDTNSIGQIAEFDGVWWFEIEIPTCLYYDELEQISAKLKELNGRA